MLNIRHKSNFGEPLTTVFMLSKVSLKGERPTFISSLHRD